MGLYRHLLRQASCEEAMTIYQLILAKKAKVTISVYVKGTPTVE